MFDKDAHNGMGEYIHKAAVLVEALPYIRSFAGKTVVIKYGGAAMKAADLKDAVMQDVALMRFVGIKPVVVHGGGPELSDMMRRIGKEPEFVDGLRVTDAATVEMAQMVFMGKTNREIVSLLGRHGGCAVGLSGQDGGLLQAQKRYHRTRTGASVDLGFVGEVVAVRPQVLQALTEAGYVPVIAPIGVDAAGQAYNINADTVAGAIAAALHADKLVLLTDVEGLRAEPGDPSSLISTIDRAEVESLMARGKLEGGMIPKLEACLQALAAGVGRVHIIDGRVPHALLLEVFTDTGVGTMVT